VRTRTLLLLILAGGLTLNAATYHLDCTNGSDDAAGTAPAAAWKSLAKLNSMVLKPGDRVLLRGGCQWEGTLAPQGSGSAGQPILLDRYGDGAPPLIRGEGALAAILLKDVEYWEVSNLEVTNEAPSEGLRRGVLVMEENARGVLHHIYLRGLRVHHVKGKLGAEMREKATGGIGFEVHGNRSDGRFDDIRVEDCVVEHVDSTGIYTWPESMTHPRDPQWQALRWTNVRVRNNRLTDIGKNAMIIRASLEPVIDHNVVVNAAARLHGNAIFVFGCKDARIEYNEVSGTRYYKLEGAAYDSDYNSEGTIIQYNYSHGNGGGLADICSNPAAKAPHGYNDGTIIRYNVSLDETDRVIAFDGPATNTKIYNNTLYIPQGLKPNIIEFDLFGASPGYADHTWIANNIIVNDGQGVYLWGDATNFSFEGNCFAGNRGKTFPVDSKAIVGDPEFVGPSGAVEGLKAAEGYRLRPGSPCTQSGVPVPDNGGHDFAGNPVPAQAPDRGAFQLPSPKPGPRNR